MEKGLEERGKRRVAEKAGYKVEERPSRSPIARLSKASKSGLELQSITLLEQKNHPQAHKERAKLNEVKLKGRRSNRIGAS